METKDEYKSGFYSSDRSDFRPFYLHQWLDVKDLAGTWLESQVIEVDTRGAFEHKFDPPNDVYQIKVHYKGWKEKYDEWFSADPNHQDAHRLRPLHTFTTKAFRDHRLPQSLRQGTYVDLLDTTDQWLPGVITQVDTQHPIVHVHYLEWDDYDEWLPTASYRIAPLGTYTTGIIPNTEQQPPSPSPVTDPHCTQHQPEHTESTQHFAKRPWSQFTVSSHNERKFREELKNRKHFVIVDQESDGNCLFRSVAHQVYGDDRLHNVVREKCLDYIASQSYFFQSFIDNENIKDYVLRLKHNGEWGGDIEIQAMAEIYNRPIEIYAYTTTPKRVYRNHLHHAPIRLSYHFSSHYNSVVEPSTFTKPHLTSQPGSVEDEHIRKAVSLGRVEGEEDAQRESDREATDKEQLRVLLSQSREQFAVGDYNEFEQAVAASVGDLENRWKETMEDAKAESEREYQDKLLLDTVLKTSAGAIHNHEVQEMEKALQASLQDTMPEAIRRCLDLGFPLENCVEAYSVCHEQHTNQAIIVDHMMQYLLSLSHSFN